MLVRDVCLCHVFALLFAYECGKTERNVRAASLSFTRYPAQSRPFKEKTHKTAAIPNGMRADPFGDLIPSIGSIRAKK
jgi:hypothetical protein